MKISPSLIGKIVGAIAVIAICIPLFLWSRSNYIIKGRVQVDTGAYINPARNIDVKLILGSVDEEMQKLVNEYDEYREFRTEKVVESLLDLEKQSSTNALGETDSDEPKDGTQKIPVSALEKSEDSGKLKINLKKLDDEEREKVSALVSKYYQNSNYCRERVVDCPIGYLFYEKGSLFWESKADNLKENRRIVFDEITTNYVTTWKDGGLAGGKIQVVNIVIKTNAAVQELKAAIDGIAEKKEVEKPQKDEKTTTVSIDNISTNDILEAVIDLKKDLQQKHRDILRKSDDILIEMILDQVTTDENGDYIFDSKSVKSGNFFISSQYDILSSEGERIEFTWFYPVAISLKHLAFNKSTTANLNELNQSKPPVDNIYIPNIEEMFLDIMDDLKKRTEIDNVKTNVVINTPESPAVTNIDVSEVVEEKKEISQPEAIPEIDVVNIVATNNEAKAEAETLKEEE